MSAVLAVGAHFDDIEIGCSGTLLYQRDQGRKIVMFVASPSNYDHWALGPLRSAETALNEGRAAAEYLGAALEVGDFPTKNIDDNSDLIETIESVIAKYQVNTVYTHWLDDVHQDHRAVARATISAARNIPNLFMFRTNWYRSPHYWSPNVFVDISDYMEAKSASIRCHRSELGRRGEEWVNHWQGVNELAGRSLGVRYAEEFMAIKMLIGSE